MKKSNRGFGVDLKEKVVGVLLRVDIPGMIDRVIFNDFTKR